jgi:hypothetical protein
MSYRTIAAFFAVRKTPKVGAFDFGAPDPDLRLLHDLAKDRNDRDNWPCGRGSIEA